MNEKQRKDWLLLEELKQQVDESTFHFRKSKDTAKRVNSYIKGDQLPQEVKELLAERDQPEMWENIFKKIDAKISGLKITSKQEIKAFGRQKGEDRVQANLITNILKTTMDSTEWWANKKRADLSLRSSGVSIVEAKIKNTGERDILGKRIKEIRYEHLPTSQCHLDPFAINPDYSDARYFHRERLLVIDELYRYFPKEKVDKLRVYTQEYYNEYSSKSTSQYSKRAKIYYSWFRKWNQRKKRDVIYYAIWSDEVILETKESPYNLRRFPISIRRMDEIDYEDPADVRGLYYNLLPIQDRINNCHLRAIHMMGTNKLLFESDAVDDAETFIEDYSQDSAVVEVNSGAITGKKIQDIKQYNEIANLRSEIADLRNQAEAIVGMNNEILGSAVNRLSGAAIENRQNAGLVGLQDFIDTSAEQDKDLAEISLELIQQYFTAETVYKITEKSEADAYFIANELERDANGAVIREAGQPKRKNSLQIGRYDIILQQMPYSRGSTAERQKVWAEYIKALQTTHPHLVPRMIEMSLLDTDSPVAMQVSKLIEEDRQAQEQNAGQAQQAQQFQMQKMQLEMQNMMAKIEEMQSKANLNKAKEEEIKSDINTPAKVGATA
ncbi:portal protein [Halarcobacter anaerophilus]|uniref:Portal protein n=1 Tax=Halarcobacter anaerophilus TaxID=877500 RepID=A0A4Q0Y0N5_9BACT|nr:hypothetical protein [Halarcobacter anaerophilus]QDF28965.1 hypothetical protein AANAER_1485 [Halarcobacter anaerophilus]RXJ63600.1 hypothetical protein CRV06_05250 [Halarcobacter anaerophilus]